MAEKDFVVAALENLPNEVLLEIFMQMDPVSIAQLCGSGSRELKHFCDDPSLWETLIRRQFPEKDVTTNPKREYFYLAGNIVSLYTLQDNGFVYAEDEETGKEVKLYDIDDSVEFARYIGEYENTDDILRSDDNELYLKVKGNPFEEDVNLWVVIVIVFGDALSYVFETQDDAMDFIYRDSFQEIMEEAERCADLEDRDIEDCLQDQGYPVPYTLTNVYKYIKLNGFYPSIRFNRDMLQLVYQLEEINFKGYP